MVNLGRKPEFELGTWRPPHLNTPRFLPRSLRTNAPFTRQSQPPKKVRETGALSSNAVPASRRATLRAALLEIGRGDWIRTSDLVVPNDARYQTALHPVEAPFLMKDDFNPFSFKESGKTGAQIFAGEPDSARKTT